MHTAKRRAGAKVVATWGAGVALLSLPLLAKAQTMGQSLEGLGTGSIVRIVLGSGSVNVRSWDRPTVQVDDASGVTLRRFTVEASGAPSTLPILAGKIGEVALPEESFAVSTVGPGKHDVVAVRARDANVTVDVPKDASLVTVQMGRGNVSLQDYRDGTFIARVRNGSVRLNNVGGDGYVQVLRGPISVDDSAFKRVRVRSGTGDVIFANSRAKQIEVSSIKGSIVYDRGSFEPGLARFETQTGNVALGVSGNAQLAAHAARGHVFTALDAGTHVNGRDGEQQAALGGGGPLVNAASGTGNVYLYSGTLSAHRTGPEWQPLREVMQRGGRAVLEAAPAPRRNTPRAPTVPRPRVTTHAPRVTVHAPRITQRRQAAPPRPHVVRAVAPQTHVVHPLPARPTLVRPAPRFYQPPPVAPRIERALPPRALRPPPIPPRAAPHPPAGRRMAPPPASPPRSDRRGPHHFPA
ncbi:MAG: DUF4097 family beta strand repeat protein, partial [Candidatus Eremiobacteraeota bacterium]|nr:DUF4097 family beta strand repeat protein [Candidatus Eremiobacteraeota bacterium]